MSNFFYKIRCALARFMYGRNGTDQLGLATLAVILLLGIVSSLVRIPLVQSIFAVIEFGMWVLLMVRMFSKNLAKRQSENAKFMAWWGPKQNGLRGAKARRADKTHKYVRCVCGTYCRVPRGVGKVELTCPKCGVKKIVKT